MKRVLLLLFTLLFVNVAKVQSTIGNSIKVVENTTKPSQKISKSENKTIAYKNFLGVFFILTYFIFNLSVTLIIFSPKRRDLTRKNKRNLLIAIWLFPFLGLIITRNYWKHYKISPTKNKSQTDNWKNLTGGGNNQSSI